MVATCPRSAVYHLEPDDPDQAFLDILGMHGDGSLEALKVQTLRWFGLGVFCTHWEGLCAFAPQSSGDQPSLARLKFVDEGRGIGEAVSIRWSMHFLNQRRCESLRITSFVGSVLSLKGPLNSEIEEAALESTVNDLIFLISHPVDLWGRIGMNWRIVSLGNICFELHGVLKSTASVVARWSYTRPRNPGQDAKLCRSLRCVKFACIIHTCTYFLRVLVGAGRWIFTLGSWPLIQGICLFWKILGKQQSCWNHLIVTLLPHSSHGWVDGIPRMFLSRMTS